MTSNIESTANGLEDSDWDTYFAKLVAFKKRNGHTKVPRHYSEDMRLAIWVAEKRKDFRLYAALKTDKEREDLYARSSINLTPTEARKLESIGFECTNKNPRHLRWDFRYQQLKAFREKYGHTQVPIGWEENVKLANWISTQRQEFKNLKNGRSSQLNEQRIALLNEIGFAWEVQRGGRRRQLKPTSSKPESPEGNKKTIVPGKTIIGRTEAAAATGSPSDKKATKEDLVASTAEVGLPQLPKEPSILNYLPNPTIQQELAWQRRHRQAYLLEQQLLARRAWQPAITQSLPMSRHYSIPPAASLLGHTACFAPLIGGLPPTSVAGLVDLHATDALAIERMLSMSRKRLLDATGPALALPFAASERSPVLGSARSNFETTESLPQRKRRRSDPPAHSHDAQGARAEPRAEMSNSSSRNSTTSPLRSAGSSWKDSSSVEPRGRGVTTNVSGSGTNNGNFAAEAASFGRRRSSVQDTPKGNFEDAENDNSL